MSEEEISIPQKELILQLFQPPQFIKCMVPIVSLYETRLENKTSEEWISISIGNQAVLLLIFNANSEKYSFKIVESESLEIVFVFLIPQNLYYSEWSEEFSHFHYFEGTFSQFSFSFSSTFISSYFLQAVKSSLTSYNSLSHFSTFQHLDLTSKKFESSSTSTTQQVSPRNIEREGSLINILFKSKKKIEISSPRGFRHNSFIVPLTKGVKKSFTFNGVNSLGDNNISSDINLGNSNIKVSSTNQSLDYTQYLPPELLAHIFSFLIDPVDICSVIQTSHRWYSICMLQPEFMERLWATLFENYFGEDRYLITCSRVEEFHSWKEKFIEEYKIKLPLKESSLIDILRKASVAGDLETVKAISRRYHIDHPLDMDGYTCLHYACIHGHTNLVQFILKSKMIPVNKRVEEVYRHGTREAGDTAIHMACQHGRLEIVKLLHEYGADLDIQGEDQRTPLHKAAMKGHLKVVMYLVSHGASLSATDRVGQHTPLDLACTFNFPEVVKYLKSVSGLRNGSSKIE